MKDRPRILYVAGSPRSGTTLLGNVLGQINTFAMVGETYQFACWFLDKRLCGCGKQLKDCAVWQQSFREAGEMFNSEHMLGIEDLSNRIIKTRHLPRYLLGTSWKTTDDIKRYGAVFDRLYRGLIKTTNAAVLVDISKSPMHAAIIKEMLPVDLKIIHITRDPRAVAFSWTRKKYERGRLYLPRHRPAFSTAIWLSWNLGIEAVARRFGIPYTRVRYEDFVKDPTQTILNITGSEHDVSTQFPFINDGYLTLEPAHSVAGNPSRFSLGEVPLRLDREWESEMPSMTKLQVTALAWPLMLRYGYRVFSP